MPVLPEVASISVSPGLIVAALLGAPDHADRRPVLDRAGRVVALELAEDDVAARRVVGAGQAHQAHQRRGADHVLDRRIGRRGVAHGEGRRHAVVPRVGIEPTLLAERDFESRASTNFATEAGACSRRAVCHTGRRLAVHRHSPGRLHAAASSRHAGAPARQRRDLLPRRSCSAGAVRRVRALAARPWLLAVADRQLRASCTATSTTCSSTCSACGCSAASSSRSGARSASCCSTSRACSPRR